MTVRNVVSGSSRTVRPRTVAMLGVAVAVATASGVLAQQARVQVLPVRGNIYVLQGAGANIVVSVGRDGVLMVDTGLPQMSDADVIAHLTRVKGIGVWSAQMFLIFALRRPDVMPTGDYGVRVAMQRAYRKRKLPDPKTMLKISAPWRPYRSVAAWYLWRSLDAATP